MATRPGIVWGSSGDPSNLTALVSALPSQIDGSVERLVRDFMREAVEEIQESIRTRGVRDGQPNGDGRVKTAAMLKSVTFRLTYNARGRVVGEFGYLQDAPRWALWQEYGTYGGQGNGQGILAMLALTDAYANFQRKLEDAMSNGRILNFNQGFYNFGSSEPVRGY